MADRTATKAGTIVVRGVVGRCGRCGGRRILRSWFRLKERCPTCGYRFKREEGFFTGVFLVNFGVTLFLLWLVLMGYVLWRSASGSTSSLVPMLLVCLGLGFAVPIAYYPLATTTWAALDLAMRPLEPEEEAEAVTWLAASQRDATT